MTERPVFVPLPDAAPFVAERMITFQWFPGFAVSQARKSIRALHEMAGKVGIQPVLEISSKSESELGVDLSAFHLMLLLPSGAQTSVECAFQGSKVFAGGGPYDDLYRVTSREAKQDERLRTSGVLVGFRMGGVDYPRTPTTAFYDWLYIQSLHSNRALGDGVMGFRGFSDIAFNPKKSANCQARSAALYVALRQNGRLQEALRGWDAYLGSITGRPAGAGRS